MGDSRLSVRIRPGLLAGLALLPFLYQAGRYWHYTNDDAYITFRYAHNLVLGRGPYFNVGERVEGYTSLLRMLEAATFIRLFGVEWAPVAAKVSGVMFGAACVLLAFALFRVLCRAGEGGPPASLALAGALAAAALIGVAPAFAVNSTSGLETTLFAGLLGLGLVLGALEQEQERWRGSGMAFALALLTRPEGSVLFAAQWLASAAVSWRRPRMRRILLRNGLCAGGVLLAHLVVRYWLYDGELLPNTYFAKRGGFWVSGGSYLHGGLLVPVLGLPGCAAAMVGLLAARHWLPGRLIPVGAVALTGLALPLVTGTDWMIGYRLAVPYLPALAILCAVGWTGLLARMPGLGSRVAAVALVLALIGAWFLQAPQRREYYEDTLVRHVGYLTGHREVAKWIRGHAQPGDTVALMDIGIIGYECRDQSILDLTGLTDRFIAKSAGTFLKKAYDPGYVLARRPAFIVLVYAARGRSYDVLTGDAPVWHGTDTEARLAGHPEFRRWYLEAPVGAAGAPHGLDRFAARVGAARAYEHGHPGIRYLLAVFRRHAVPAADESRRS